MIRIIVFLVVGFSIFSCSGSISSEKEFIGYLKANDSVSIPFNFIIKDSVIKITNSKENVYLQINSTFGDSIKLTSYVFEDFIMFKNHNDSLRGFYYNNSLSRKIPFSAILGSNRFPTRKEKDYKIFSGNWHVIFNNGDNNIFNAEMIVNQLNNEINGTVRTETGDYGFMEGVVRGGRFSMSNFNGYRGYLMDGYINNDTINGYLYRGNYDAISFKAYKDDNFELSDPYGLTKLKEGYDEFIFSFENIEGNLVSNNDKKFKNKIVLIQLMGSWCPNCLDESRYLSKLISDYDDITLVSIAFEYAKSKDQAIKNLKNLKDRLNINYDILLAQFGTSNKLTAASKLESLDTLISYPTLIVIDKKNKVKLIHTGFNGPATGVKFDEFKLGFEGFLSSLRTQ